LKADGFSRDAKGIASIVLEAFAKLVFRQVIHRLRKQALSAVHIAAIEKAKAADGPLAVQIDYALRHT